ATPIDAVEHNPQQQARQQSVEGNGGTKERPPGPHGLNLIGVKLALQRLIASAVDKSQIHAGRRPEPRPGCRQGLQQLMQARTTDVQSRAPAKAAIHQQQSQQQSEQSAQIETDSKQLSQTQHQPANQRADLIRAQLFIQSSVAAVNKPVDDIEATM